jgi:hypothetical protein
VQGFEIMPESYNPIIRTFCQFRAGLRNCIDIDRHEVRPGTPLEAILPEQSRQEVWQELRRRGLRLPDLERSERDGWRIVFRALRAAVSSALFLRRWTALLLVVPLALALSWATRRRAVGLPRGLKTVGELVIYATCFGEHKASGYRWTRNEIALKVRLIIAESLGLPLDAIQPETTLAEMAAM